MRESSESINLDDSKNDIVSQGTPLKNFGNAGVDETVLDVQTVEKLSWMTLFCECFRISNIFSNKLKLPDLLSPQALEYQDKLTLVLDLDETLVHSSFQPIQTDLIIDVRIDQKTTKVFVLKRPGLDNFLEKVTELFEVIIFTASLEGYARPLLEVLDPHQKIAGALFRDSCTLSQNGYIKDLSRLGRPLNKTLIIDVIFIQNSPHSYSLHKSNAIPISTWTEDPQDKELYSLLKILEKLSIANNIPKILSDLKKRSKDLSFESIHSAICNDSVLTRGYYNSPVHLKSKRFQF